MNMDNSTETKQESSPGKLESLAKDADLKAEMEKAKEWIKTNPLPAGKSEIRRSFKYINSIYNRKTCNTNLPSSGAFFSFLRICYGRVATNYGEPVKNTCF